MIEVPPEQAAALSLYHSPGVYAIMIGSGLSRAAGIPTGWEITVDLVSRYAALRGAGDQADLVDWYKTTTGAEPNYSEILDALASTPAERRSILHHYIEPSSDDEDRRPSAAHRAIARLVKRGSVRVIITTNFDRLIEAALRDEGIEPTVISSADALAGAEPLVHARCTVLKLHGDYLDTRILNTETELANYPEPINRLLDEILDAFGLIVCGWSGEWDPALRNAILRSPSRRYQTYWATKGVVSGTAQSLIDQRKAVVIPIRDADSFFTRLNEMVDALSAVNRPAPETVSVAVALAKKYSPDDRYEVSWAELLAEEVGKVRLYVTGPDFPASRIDAEALNALVQEFVGRSEILRQLALLGSRWGTDSAARGVERAVVGATLGSTFQGGSSVLGAMRNLAGTFACYWALAGAIYREDWPRVVRLLNIRVKTWTKGDEAAAYLLPMAAYDDCDWKFLEGYENRRTPGSDFLFEIFKEESRQILIDPADAGPLFNDVERLLTLQFAYIRNQKIAEKPGLWFWSPFGRFAWDREHETDMFGRFAALAVEHPLLKAGLFDGNPTTANEVLDQLRKFYAENWRPWG